MIFLRRVMKYNVVQDLNLCYKQNFVVVQLRHMQNLNPLETGWFLCQIIYIYSQFPWTIPFNQWRWNSSSRFSCSSEAFAKKCFLGTTYVVISLFSIDLFILFLSIIYHTRDMKNMSLHKHDNTLLSVMDLGGLYTSLP